MERKIISKKMKIFLFIIFISSLLCYISSFALLFNGKYTFEQFNKDINSLDMSNLKLYISRNDFIPSFNRSTLIKEYEPEDNINTIYFYLTSQNIEINSYGGKNILVEVNGSNLFDISELSMYQIDDTLTFLSPDILNSSLNIIINLPEEVIKNYNISVSNNSGDIDIYSLCIDSLNCSTDSGDISLNSVKTNYLTLKNLHGDSTLNKTTSKLESTFNLNDGNFFGNGYFGFINANTVSGNIHFNLNDVSKDMYLISASGDIKLDIPHNLKYKLDYSSLSGKLNSPEIPYDKENCSIIHIKTLNGTTSINPK